MSFQTLTTWSLRFSGVLLALSLIALFVESRPKEAPVEDPHRALTSATCANAHKAKHDLNSEQEFVVASVNLWHWGPNPQLRLKNLAEHLCALEAEFLPDVIFIQDVKKIPFGFNNSFLSADYLQKKLGGYQVHVAKDKNDSLGIALLIRENSFIENIQTKVLSFPPGGAETPTDEEISRDPSSTENQRHAILADLRLKNGALIRAVNVHLAENTAFSNLRVRQLTKIMGWVTQIESQQISDLLIIGGDFNTGIDAAYLSEEGVSTPFYNSEFDVFLQDPHFEFLLRPNEHTTPTFFDQINNSKYRSDFIFSSQQKNDLIAKLRASEKIYPLLDSNQNRLSDHDAVIHKFTIEYVNQGLKSDF